MSILAIAFAMVSPCTLFDVSLLTIIYSVGWVCMYLEGLLTKVLVAAVGRVRTMLRSYESQVKQEYPELGLSLM